MIFNKNPEIKGNDYFDGPDLPDPVKKEKEPKYNPDDPEYWEQDESPFEHISTNRKMWIWWVVGTGVLIGIIIGLWLRFFNPAQQGVVQYGYIEQISKEGMFFKTFEGVLIPYKELFDTTRIYQRDFVFTAANSKVAAQLKAMEKGCVPVRMEYDRYYATVPWRGNSKIIVTRVDTANVDSILPPEFRPQYSPSGLKQDPLGETSGAKIKSEKKK